MHDKSQESNTLPHTVVFIAAAGWALWPAGYSFTTLNNFLDDMDALGFAIWRTPSVVYVFAGE